MNDTGTVGGQRKLDLDGVRLIKSESVGFTSYYVFHLVYGTRHLGYVQRATDGWEAFDAEHHLRGRGLERRRDAVQWLLSYVNRQRALAVKP